jgi:hypothetical protein
MAITTNAICNTFKKELLQENTTLIHHQILIN